MSPANPAQSESDQAIDAVVYDVHPAVYPYSPQPPNVVNCEFAPRSSSPLRLPAFLRFDAPSSAEYMVPRRFGMSAILGIMTALAVLFGAFRYMNVHPAAYLFFGVQSLLICLAQMFFGRAPRAASAVAGAIILPAFIVLTAAFARRAPEVLFLLGLAAIGIPGGAFLGYLTGTMAAGVFLVMDMAERFLWGQPVMEPTLPSSSTVRTT